MNILSLVFLWIFNVLVLPKALVGPGGEIAIQKNWAVLGFLLLAGLVALIQSGRSGQSVFSSQKAQLNALTLAVTAYCLWILVAANFASLPGFAYFGYTGTQFGGLMVIGCILLASIYSKTTITTRALVNTLLGISVVMVLFEVLEALGFRPLKGFTDIGNVVYPASLIGFRQYLGGWWSIMSLLPVFLYRQQPRDTRFWGWVTVIAVGLALCSNSAASLGVLVGLAGWLVWSLVRERQQLRASGAILAGVVLALLVLPPAFAKATSWLGHGTSSFKDYGATNTVASRTYLWKAAWRASLERPVFGWGAETFIYQTFPHLSDDEMSKLAHIEMSLKDNIKVVRSGYSYVTYNPATKKYDHGNVLYVWPHNILLDELYSRGFISLLLLLLIIGLTIRHVYLLNKVALPYFILLALPYSIYLMAWFYASPVTPFYFMVIGLALANLKTFPFLPPPLTNPDGEP